MKNNTKLIAGIAGTVLVVAVIMVTVLNKVNGDLDVIGQGSFRSFGEVLEAASGQLEADEANGGWSLSAPDQSARFVWSQDYSKSPGYDVMLEFDAKPFLDAGLDAASLPESYTVADEKLVVGSDLGDEALVYEVEPTALEAYGQIVKKHRSAVSYHMGGDHYGVGIGHGNGVEWANDLEMNMTSKEAQDKDLVFVLNPEPLIAAGVDPEKVEGWNYAVVHGASHGGKSTDSYKFLKPVSLD